MQTSQARGCIRVGLIAGNKSKLKKMDKGDPSPARAAPKANEGKGTAEETKSEPKGDMMADLKVAPAMAEHQSKYTDLVFLDEQARLNRRRAGIEGSAAKIDKPSSDAVPLSSDEGSGAAAGSSPFSFSQMKGLSSAAEKHSRRDAADDGDWSD